MINTMGMKRFYDKVMREENTALSFPIFEHWDGGQNLVTSRPDDQAIAEWELHTLEDMRCNDNHQNSIKYWS